MCLFTHFAAGALAGGLTGNPWLGIVAGAASHAVLDAIPHYDHPDWRVELGGGIASLILLLLMPFATLPAILGGLAGMLPDLENLFQKLGKMRRDQFIFPSHTGLIPHGRNLPPSTLVWQAVIFVCCFGLLGLFSPATATAADNMLGYQAAMGEPQVQVLKQGQDQTRLKINFPVDIAPANWQELDGSRIKWALPSYLDQDSGPEDIVLPPRLDLTLAVPTNRALQVDVSGVSWWRQPDQPNSAINLVRFGLPAVWRSVPLASGTVALGSEGGVLRSIILDISHPAAGKAREQLRLARDFQTAGKVDNWSPMSPPGVLNPQLLQALARGGRELALQNSQNKAGAEKGLYNHFDQTSNWIRLSLSKTGVYSLTGQDLTQLGVDAQDVDPTKLRVFQGGGWTLDPDPTVAESDQLQEVGLTEVAIQVLDGEDGEWNLDDEIRFYGISATVWADRLDPDALPLDHFEHLYSDTGVFWLTWESMATASPIPGTPLRVEEVTVPATGQNLTSIARRRVHAEEHTSLAAGVVADNWAWDSSIYSSRTGGFDLHRPVADSLATFVIDFRGNPIYRGDSWYHFVANGWINSNTDDMASTEFQRDAQHDSLRCRVVGQTSGLLHGENSFVLQNGGTSPVQPLALDSADIFYWGELDMRGQTNPFPFSHWQDQVSSPGQSFDLQLTVSNPEQTVVWDVSNPQNPRLLAGDVASGADPTITLGVLRDPGTDLHLVAHDEGNLLQVAAGDLVSPRDLRAQSTDVDYLVIYAEPFVAAANDLADYHAQELVGITSPQTAAVSLADIYDNFSGGRKDAMAIRNYLKFVYEDGQRLQYACFLGNASRDYRNYNNHTPFIDLVDFLPTQLRTTYPINGSTSYRNFPYASDDGLSSFDAPPLPGDLDHPDLATGRLPATSAEEASRMVQAMISYGSDPEEGLWRNQFLMAADDCNIPTHYPHPLLSENSHTAQAEVLTNSFVPGSIDITKIYGLEYDFPPGSLVKPQCRADINAALNQGTTIFHYVGHGAEDNLADEQIFQSRDIANLNNGLRRPFFVAFSCDVGVFDNPTRRSMAELFVTSESGGAIGSICASQVSFISNNNVLSSAFYASLYPSDQVTGLVTVSDALMLAKAQMGDVHARRNSQRYTLFSDPGLTLPNPVSDLSFAPSTVDTLRAGMRQVVTASTNGGGAMLGAGDTYDLRVEESAYDKVYIVNSHYLDHSVNPPVYRYSPFERTFVKLGATVFRGNGTMESDDLAVPFKVPSQLRYGDQASVRLLIEGLNGQHAAEMDLPAVRSATGPVDDILGPVIGMSLPNRYRVRPGDPLEAALSDTSGIAILGTSPGNSILLEFDGTGFMTDVTESFSYDANSYTVGRLMFPLPSDIATGEHTAALHASDALGNVGSDTLSFTVAEYGVTGINDVTLFPNPTPGPCRLVFDLTDPMEIQWEIYTLAGRRIKTQQESFSSAGPGIMEWDGRDDQGDEIANGTYLFVLRGHWAGSGGHDLKQTGKLVIMR